MYSHFSRRSMATLLFVVFSVSIAAAQEKSNRLTPSDIFNLESVSDPQISPDGKKIIYVRGFSDIMTDTRYSNLWIINFDGSDNRPAHNRQLQRQLASLVARRKSSRLRLQSRRHATDLLSMDGHAEYAAG